MSRSEIRDDGLPVVSEDKGYSAYQLKKAGHTWDEIATIVGYGSGKVAAVETRRYITESAAIISIEQREEILNLELDRLDALLNAVWNQAMEGDTRAVDSALKVINTRAKLLALDTISTSGTVTNNTVVVTGNTEDFIRSLQRVDGQTE